MGHGHSRIEYPDPSGRSNTNANALSRAPLEEEEAEGVIVNIAGEKVGLAASQRRDEELLTVIRFLETGLMKMWQGRPP